MIAILNASILTTFGDYTYTALNLEDAKELLKEGFTSYVAHNVTNEFIGKLFDIDLPYKREMYYQQVGEKAIVFKLNSRLAAGQLLKKKQEIDTIGYTIGLLIKK